MKVCIWFNETILKKGWKELSLNYKYPVSPFSEIKYKQYLQNYNQLFIKKKTYNNCDIKYLSTFSTKKNLSRKQLCAQ